MLSADDYAKIGGVNQWVRVRDDKGHEGFAAAWYLEKTQTATPVVETVPASTSTVEAPAPTNPNRLPINLSLSSNQELENLA